MFYFSFFLAKVTSKKIYTPTLLNMRTTYYARTSTAVTCFTHSPVRYAGKVMYAIAGIMVTRCTGERGAPSSFFPKKENGEEKQGSETHLFSLPIVVAYCWLVVESESGRGEGVIFQGESMKTVASSSHFGRFIHLCSLNCNKHATY